MSEDFPVQLARFRPGALIAGYRLEAQIGAGGMAVVFRARDERLGRLVALKVLAPALTADSAFRIRFMAESRAAAAVDDPHIIPVHEAGEAEGALFIAMRFVQGGDLRRVLEREGPLAPGRAAEFISPVASALDAAHRAGLVHRDVKPANILVDASVDRPDHVYLSDFGVSKGAATSVSLTGTGQFLGTPGYSAPEQIQGRAVDGRTDQYALACVAYQLLTGEMPFERDQGMAVLLAHLSEPPPCLSSRRPDLPAAADEVLARGMAKVPEKRYASCRDFADALRETLGLTPYHPRRSATTPDHPQTAITAPPGSRAAAAGAGLAAIPADLESAGTVDSVPGAAPSMPMGVTEEETPAAGGMTTATSLPTRKPGPGSGGTAHPARRPRRLHAIALVSAVLVVAAIVASVLAISPNSPPTLSSRSSSSSTTTARGPVTVPGGIGQVPLAAASGPKHAGTITWAVQPGTAPNWIFPVVPGASNSVFNNFTFIWEMWRPLYWTVFGTDPELYPPMSIANPAVYSSGDKTVTISLKSSYKWSNGQAITANDILFFIDLIKAAIKESPANWEGYVPGHFPDNIASTSEPNAATLVLNLTSAVNPTWFTEDVLGQGPIIPIPSTVWARESASGPVIPPSGWTPATMKKIFDYLTAQAESLSTFATNPLWQVVDGPYKLSAYNATTGAFTMVPNTTYGGPHVTPMSNFQGVPFASNTAEFNAIRAGDIDVAYVGFDDVPQLPAVQRSGYSYLGEPDFGLTFAAYNFKDTTGDFNNIIAQLYIRQALAHLVDQQGWITAFMHGAGAPAYGPIPAYPQSPYLPADAATNPYPFSVSDAVSILKAHGWTVNPGGTDVCSSPGTGPSNCGAGIPAGTKLAWNYIYSTSPALIGYQATDFVSKAKQAGINITLSSSNFNYMIANYLDPSAPANENEWAMEDFGGETDVPYATTFGLFNTGGDSQIGDYSNPTADSLINASISGADPAAVKNEASFLTANQPVQFQPNLDLVWAWKNTLSAVNPQAWENLTQYYATPEFWYFN